MHTRIHTHTYKHALHTYIHAMHTYIPMHGQMSAGQKNADIRAPSKEHRNKRTPDISAPHQMSTGHKGADINIMQNFRQ